MVMPFKQLFFKRWKGRKRCMRQSRKILWVVLRSIKFLKEFLENGTRDHRRLFAHVPYCLSGLSRPHFFSTTFLESESDKYALLTKREVKMAGFWPSSFSCFIYRDEVEVNKKRPKKKDQFTVILIERAWSIIYPRVANQNEGFPFILTKQKRTNIEYNKTKKPLLTRRNLPVGHLQTTLFLDSERPRMKQKQVVDTEREARTAGKIAGPRR